MTLDILEVPYVVGIDLGTTNSAVAYMDLRQNDGSPGPLRMMRIPQLTGRGEIGNLEVLPSFLYIPGSYDLPQDITAFSWQKNQDMPHIVGQFARDHGARIPSRLISSAKSWLCHGQADRRAPILPWGAAEGIRKMSPVATTAAYLQHIRKAWNSVKGEDPENHLENQLVILTVPASFDEVARDLTVEAATLAGLKSVTLLEEPLAAFYSWLLRHEKNWKQKIAPQELVLVCDVGGGTTDFTLITLEDSRGGLRFERMAVGDHLILGGDNADLALARLVEQTADAGTGGLSNDRWKTLCHLCRQAKEEILEDRAHHKKITLPGEGSRLIAGTLSATLDRRMIEKIVVDGFFPMVDDSTASKSSMRPAITEFGLPYEPDPAVTRHLIRFLERHRSDILDGSQRDNPAPDYLLFNGGSLKPVIIQERIRSAVGEWFGLEEEKMPRILDNPALELAVARGAAYYGLVKAGRGVRVGGGSPRSYYIGVGTQDQPQATAKALCVVERGVEEGSAIDLADLEFKVRTNQPVAFDLYASSYRSGDHAGDTVAIDDSLTALPPIQTVVQYGKKGVQAKIPVTLEAGYTEIGTLALWCCSRISTHRWKLQFQLRASIEKTAVAEQQVFESEIVETARNTLATVFGAGRLAAPPEDSIKRLPTVVKDIAVILGRNRKQWPMSLIRTLGDDLLKIADSRKGGPLFESRWLNLCGFLLRPGFGDAADPRRLARLWKIYLRNPLFGNNLQVRTEWWIMWRRLAGGLRHGQQRQFAQDVMPQLGSRRSKSKKHMAAQERLELWMAAASMEQLLVHDKLSLGNLLLSEIKPKKCKPQHLWSLARIGTREPLYASVDRVVPPVEVTPWIAALMAQTWRNPKPVLGALCQMARRTGDRARDLEPAFLESAVAWMQEQGADETLTGPLKRVTAICSEEQNLIFGESLPAGLILDKPSTGRQRGGIAHGSK